MTAPFRPRLAALALAVLATLAYRPAEAQDKAKAKAKAKLTVLVPADASSERPLVLKVQGVVVPQTGTKRVIYTKRLTPGVEHAYELEAIIQPNNYTKIFRPRTVTVKAGESITVDLRNEDKKAPDRVVIRWVPTPKDIVREMCKLAKIGKDDIVLDPGCGDGIMIITAVKEYKAKKGLGIDINPVRVKEAQEAAKEAGVADRVQIKLGDALKLKKSDLGDASVVMLYMGRELNIRLKPTLWKYLKPGTRVVSHRFLMGKDWPPEKTITVKGKDGDDYDLHLWTITGKEGKE
jgi:uncharacterized protein (TIGR03000 family)